MEHYIISLPYGIVDLAISQRWTKELAYFCHIKKLYGNGIIYNYTSRKLAEKLSKSHGTVNSHVQWLIEKGLLFYKHGHLICANHKQLREIVVFHKSHDYRRETGNGLLKIKVHNKILHTEWNISARVAINSINKQRYVSRIKSEVNAIDRKLKSKHNVSKKEISRYRKFIDRFDKTEKDTGETVCYLSDAKIGFLLKGRSTSNVREMFKFWEEQGLIAPTFVKGRTLDTHVSIKSYVALKDYREGFSSTYFFKGRIIEFNKRTLSYGLNLKPREVKSTNSKYSYTTNRELESISKFYKGTVNSI